MLQLLSSLPGDARTEAAKDTSRAGWRVRLRQDSHLEHAFLMRHVQKNVRLEVATDEHAPELKGLSGCCGTLYLAASRVLWFSEEAASGFSVDYGSIVLHAVMNGKGEQTQGLQEPCLYLQVELGTILLANGQEMRTGDSSCDEADDIPFAELRFYLQDTRDLQALFEAACECAALHPDVDGDSGLLATSEDEGEDRNEEGGGCAKHCRLEEEPEK